MDFKQGDFEKIILSSIWKMEENSFFDIDVSKVKENINTEKQSWAYTTVKTVLDRLVKKNTLERIKFNKKYFYKSKISREEEGLKAVKKLAHQYFNGEVGELIKTAEKIHDETLLLTR